MTLNSYNILILSSPTLDHIENIGIIVGGPGLYGGLAAKLLGCNVYTLGPVGAEDLNLLEIYNRLDIRYLGPIVTGCAYRFRHRYTGHLRSTIVLCSPHSLSHSEISVLKEIEFDAMIISPVGCELHPSLLSWIYTNLKSIPILIDVQGITRCFKDLWVDTLPSIGTFYHVSSDDISDHQKLKMIRGITGYTAGTQGGIILYDGRVVDTLPKVLRAYSDPTGAGDIFSTSFICDYLRTGDAIESFKRATIRTEALLPVVKERLLYAHQRIGSLGAKT